MSRGRSASSFRIEQPKWNAFLVMLDLGHDALFENLTVVQLMQESPFYIIQRLFLTGVRFGVFPAINVNNSVLGCDALWPGRYRHLVKHSTSLFILISR